MATALKRPREPKREVLADAIHDARTFYADHAGNSTQADRVIGPMLWLIEKLADPKTGPNEVGVLIEQKLRKALAAAPKAAAKQEARTEQPAGAAS